MRLENSTMIWQSCKRILTEWTDFSFLRHIRGERLCSCVVLFSSEPNFENARQGIIYGAFDYLTEPFD